jgi:PB1 domain
MTLTPDTPYKDFVDTVAAKFGALPSAITLKFKDEEDEKVSLLDASDYDLALETARALAKGKPEGRLEVWCFDA